MCILAGLSACGGNDTKSPDATIVNVPQSIKLSGVASGRTPSATTPLSGVAVSAFSNSDDTTPIMSTTSDATGAYSLTIATNGVPVDGYVKATITGFVDTYLYPPAPLVADFDSASINMVNTDTINLLSDTLCHSAQMLTNGAVAIEVVDATGATVGGAVATASPAPSKICYDSNGFPNSTAMVTATDGLAYMLNVTGDVTVGATLTGMTFTSHHVNARVGALTTTLISP